MECVVYAAALADWAGVDVEAARALLPAARFDRVVRENTQQQRRTLAAYGLLRLGVRRFLKLDALPEIDCGKLGKPYFAAYPAFCFSVSHTEGLALCAFDAFPVGVDAEHIEPVRPERARRLSLRAESAAFFDGWTERESRIKRRGGSALACRSAVVPEPSEYVQRLPLGADYAGVLCRSLNGPARLVWYAPDTLFP